MDLLSIVIRSDTRIRLEFTSAVDATAFTGSGSITIECLDGTGLSPTIKKRLAVTSATNTIECVLSEDLAQGGLYEVVIVNIPAADTSFANATQQFRPGTKFTVINSEIDTPDVEKALYGIDLVWTGVDYLQTPDGDLAITAGRANVQNALERRLVAEGLPWDNNYGVKPRNFVDGPSAATPILRGEILRQMLSDNRVQSATVRLELDEDNVDEASYFVDVQLVGSSNSSDLSLAVPSENK